MASASFNEVTNSHLEITANVNNAQKHDSTLINQTMGTQIEESMEKETGIGGHTVRDKLICYAYNR